MARHQLQNPWPQIEREPLDMTAEELATGHPSAPGYREISDPRHGRPSPGNGQPGIPKIRPGRRGQKGFPANSGGGFPVQPDIFYDGEFEDE